MDLSGAKKKKSVPQLNTEGWSPEGPRSPVQAVTPGGAAAGARRGPAGRGQYEAGARGAAPETHHLTCTRVAQLCDAEEEGGGGGANIPAGEAQSKELYVMDASQLTDEELKNRLRRLGVTPGPIVASTRALYEKKLLRLLNVTSNPTPTSTVDTNQYSEEEDDCSGSEYAGSEGVKGVEQSSLIDSRVGECSLGDDSYYPRCFLPPSGLWQRHDPMLNISSEEDPGTSMDSTAEKGQALVASPVLPTLGSNTFTGPPPTQGVKPLCMSLDGGLAVTTSLPSQTFSITQLVEEMEKRKPYCNKVVMEGITSTSNEQRLRDKSHVEPKRDVLTEMFPDMVRTPTGISATCRRPIKGAAGRPVQFKYPSTPSSPGTKEREKLQQQLVPVWIQIVVFLFVTSFLYLIYGATTDGLINPFTALVTAWNHNKGDMEEVQAFDALQDPAVPFLAGED
ncbi:lamina-associated polypeptide 2-like [Scleropages formosus]|uniref:lamina-associated polypeptide 2-like n=1 Tax=Scleropages formosus TaxID=113540 RepID=UPI0010FAAED6|nr:lamina-associated polypeptide 2-like [Scleropages formosus]